MHQLASETKRKILPLMNADHADRKEKTSNHKGHEGTQSRSGDLVIGKSATPLKHRGKEEAEEEIAGIAVIAIALIYARNREKQKLTADER